MFALCVEVSGSIDDACPLHHQLEHTFGVNAECFEAIAHANSLNGSILMHGQ
jgi:hypothetical protein